MPDDQTTGKVQHGQIRIGALFPSDQQASIAVEPAMSPFDDPAPRPCSVTLGLALIPTTSNPGHHPDLPDMLIDAATDIAPIQAQPRTRCGCRLVDDDLRQPLFQQPAVMSVGAIDDQGQRQTVTVSEQAALDAPFAAVGRVGADFFPRPTGLSSSCHRAPASPSQSSRALRTPAVPLARSVRTRPHQSTRETADAPTSASTIPWHLAHPTACRCAAPAESHPSPSGPGCVADGSPTDGVWAAGSAAPSVPIRRRSTASHHHVASSSPCPPNRESRSLDKQERSYFNLPG